MGEGAGSTGTLSLSDKAVVNATQVLLGRESGATGILNANDSTINSTDGLIIGTYGDGIANLVNNTIKIGDLYSLTDSKGTTAKVTK